MKEERIIQEKLNLVEKELITLTEKLEEMDTSIKDMEELKFEIKGLKLLMGRLYPDFKKEFPDIMRKIVKP